MKTKLLILLLSVLLCEPLLAQQGGRFGHDHKGQGQHHTNRNNHGNRHRRTVVVRRPAFSRSRVVVVRPRRFRTVSVLPLGCITYNHRRRDYYFHNGLYYQGAPSGYAVVAAPFGLRIRVLPVGYHRVMFGAVPHFYYMGTYYRQNNNEEYETVEPAVGAIVPELPDHDVDEVTIDGKTFFEYDNVLYKSVVTNEGVQYEVVGKLDK
ncbi:MAG TPA: DUF6515 family protein [Catalimonadaceae bacterium]|nr:DUF6515 family protein [Catalimonadaceae bacterium]